MMDRAYLTWWGIVRLGFVQTALGAIVVLTTATMNRVMVVEYALPAVLPGALVTFHYLVQMSRPKFGYGSDIGGSRTRWIIGGMMVLALGGVGAAIGTAMMGTLPLWGIIVAFVSFLLIGAGVGAAGTSLLALLAKQVEKTRRPAAATIVWFMMIMGFALTAGLAGHFLDPFSGQRLVLVTSIVASLAVLVTFLALYKIESQRVKVEVQSSVDGDPATDQKTQEEGQKPMKFKAALQEILAEGDARSFTIFVFVSMLAYSAQDLILEPFAGTVFGMTPGESTKLSGLQHSGVMLGMILVALSGTLLKRFKSQVLRFYVVAGCLASAVVLFAIAASGFNPDPTWFKLIVFLLGVANGAFAVAAIGSMMALAGHGRENREGLRMGLWGAAQAIAFALGGFLGTIAIDITRVIYADPAVAYALVFSLEATLFIVAAKLGYGIRQSAHQSDSSASAAFFGDASLAQSPEARQI